MDVHEDSDSVMTDSDVDLDDSTSNNPETIITPKSDAKAQKGSRSLTAKDKVVDDEPIFNMQSKNSNQDLE